MTDTCRTCETCRWWVPIQASEYSVYPSNTIGYCHGGPPKGNNGIHEQKWPTSRRDDWCGEHQPRESEASKDWWDDTKIPTQVEAPSDLVDAVVPPSSGIMDGLTVELLQKQVVELRQELIKKRERLARSLAVNARQRMELRHLNNALVRKTKRLNAACVKKGGDSSDFLPREAGVTAGPATTAPSQIVEGPYRRNCRTIECSFGGRYVMQASDDIEWVVAELNAAYAAGLQAGRADDTLTDAMLDAGRWKIGMRDIFRAMIAARAKS